MSEHDLRSDEGLRLACEEVGRPATWGDEYQEWVPKLAETIQWVRLASEGERSSYDFQHRLWEQNHVAALGRGNIPVDRALRDEGFRKWLAARSMKPFRPSEDERLSFLKTLYQELRAKLQPFLDRKVSYLKIFRVLAALYPEGMTTVASGDAMKELISAMGAGRDLEPVERHHWVRRRLDALLGGPDDEPAALAERMALPWMLYARFVQPTEEEEGSARETQLVPLPAARRRKGLTGIKGYFPGLLSTLEFVRDGVTKQQLIDFLRTSSPDSKNNSLLMSINVAQSEFGAIRLDRDRYVLTETGKKVLESQDPDHLSDWLLTRILGVDRAIAELHDRGPLLSSELSAAVRSVNPGWTSNAVPNMIFGWLRSMGVIEKSADGRLALTPRGREWASRIHWQPESLPVEPDPEPDPIIIDPRPIAAKIALPQFADIVASVQAAGHFPADVIARLHAGLWSHARRHFAILTGLSGSGKTLLARAYASALAQGGSERQLFTLPVQPGWYDPGALLGFTNPLRGDSYVRTGFLDFLIRAALDPGRPYIAVFDEMNLSHPEQYMAPLLSAMETGDAIQLHTEGDFFDGVPGAIQYPRNLVLIGTVNMDETTHGLSDKVLDRAFVLEFWGVDLAAYPHWGTRRIDPGHETQARNVLVALMEALSPARLHFGWRVVDDVLDFLQQAASSGETLSFEAALDGVIYAKVLPKLRGEDAPRVREAFKRCEEALASFGLEGSRAKVAELRHDLETTGSARFWR